MAYLKNEMMGRNGGLSKDGSNAKRKFLVIAQSKTEYGPDMVAVAGMPDYNDFHPRFAGLYAKEYSWTQDSKVWWKWIVTVTYKQLEPGDKEDPTENPFDNPLDRDPEIGVDTQTIMVAAKGEVDATTGAPTEGITTSAGEPYDPTPEEELEILVVSITRWDLPGFSIQTYKDYQNSVNDASFTFGDLTIEEGQAKVRIRINPKEFWVSPDDGSTIPFRQFDITLAISELTWDLELLDWGTYYIDSGGKIKRFLDDTEPREFGLLDGFGGKLGTGAAEVFNTFKNKKRVDFAPLALPSGP